MIHLGGRLTHPAPRCSRQRLRHHTRGCGAALTPSCPDARLGAAFRLFHVVHVNSFGKDVPCVRAFKEGEEACRPDLWPYLPHTARLLGRHHSVVTLGFSDALKHPISSSRLFPTNTLHLDPPIQRLKS